MRTKRRRKRASEARVPLAEASRAGQRWSMDFVSDCLVGDRRIRVFAAIDQYTRECVSLMGGGIKLGEMVSRTLPLEEINRAFDLMHTGEVIRSVILF